ncbi:MAG TPA: cupin-like domain-containing protein [Steroidobacteraceae bacterium]|nr:cupin-like domain-containing protein [Steroidobacteraceae bacterium]
MAGSPIREVSGIDPAALADSLLDSTEPVVVRGLAAQWPLVQAARRSPGEAAAYLLRLYAGMKVTVVFAAPEVRGRFFYNADLTGFNFRRAKTTLASVLADLERASRDPSPPGVYMGSTDVDECLPGFRAENDLGFGTRDPYVRIWIGNRTRIAAHQDLPTNLACVVSGRRRFTLFPPEQLANLYIGPLEFTPAGQAVSLVDFASPDFERFPRFAQALEQSRVAELSAGDAILIPSLWWHHIEGLEDLNILVNYWWRRTPAHLGAPNWALMLAMLSIREMPPEQRSAWQEIFRHYVFEADESTAAHIPEGRRGALSSFDEESARALRAAVQSLLGR